MSRLSVILNLDQVEGVTFADDWKQHKHALLLHCLHSERLGRTVLVADWKMDGQSVATPPEVHDLKLAFEYGKRGDGLVECVSAVTASRAFDVANFRCFLSNESPLVSDSVDGACVYNHTCHLHACSQPPTWEYEDRTVYWMPVPGRATPSYITRKVFF